MTDNSVPDYLKTEHLYDQASRLILDEEATEQECRGEFDRIFAMGKAIGRRSALDELKYPTELKDLRTLRSQVQLFFQTVDIHPGGLDALKQVVAAFSESDARESRRDRAGFEDRLINDWLKIVDD